MDVVKTDSGPYEPGRAVRILLQGEDIGGMGLVSGSVRAEWRLTDPVGVFELRLAPFLSHVFRVPVAQVVDSYPGVDRDVAMLVGAEVTHEQVFQAIWAAAPRELVDVRLFDIYAGEQVGGGRKSMAYSLTYRAMDRTLTDDEANRFHDAVKAALQRDVGAEIRQGR